MKKFLLISASLVAAYLAMTVAYDGLNLALVRLSSGNVAAKMERLFGDLPTDEIPILGSSRAQANFVPAVLGIRFYNYGIDGSGQRETLFHLAQLVNRGRSGLIIVNVDPWGFANFGQTVTYGFQGCYTLAARQRAVRDSLPDGLVGFMDWLPGVRFQGQLRNNLTQMLNARRAVTKVVDRGAVLLKNSRSDAEWKYLDARIGPKDFCLPSRECAEKLLELQRKIQERKGALKVVFVIGPCSPSWRRQFHGEVKMQKWIESFYSPETPIIDLFSNSDYGYELFTDPTHLNIQGARQFSQELKMKLVALKLL